MKTLRIVFMAWAACGLIAVGAAAFQEQSFQYTATHGMFEDMYDLFTDSPAYLASFEKNVIWSQLSNLRSRYDNLFGYNPADSQWQVGGTTDLIGPGRLGVMFDYGANSEPYSNWRFWAPAAHSGFGEGTQVDYEDKNGDNIIDYRRELYSRSEAQENGNWGEVYVGYGLGLQGLDAGIGVRGQWEQDSPTYNPATFFWMGDFPFDQAATSREVDLITGQTLYTYDMTSSGSWNRDWMDWGLVLAARSQDAFGLMSGLGLLVNVRPYLFSSGNDYEANYQYAEDFSPSNPDIISRQTYEVKESGFEDGGNYEDFPYSGFGVNGYVRADYTQWGVNWTGWLNVESSAYSPQNAEFVHDSRETIENTDTFSTPPVYTTTTRTYGYDQKVEGKGGFNWVEVRLRGQIPLTGWRLGFGINGILNSSDMEKIETISAEEAERWDAGTGVPADSYTRRTNYMEKRRIGWGFTGANLQFPLAIVIDILKNLSVQVSGQYQIQRYAHYATREVLESPVPATVTTYDDGSVDVVIPGSFTTYTGDYFHAEQNAYVETNFSTSFAYGLTWKPWEQVQIDLTGLSEPDRPQLYRASFCLYY